MNLNGMDPQRRDGSMSQLDFWFLMKTYAPEELGRSLKNGKEVWRSQIKDPQSKYPSEHLHLE